MVVISVIMAAMAVIFYLTSLLLEKGEQKPNYRNFFVVAGMALAAKILFAGIYFGHSTDVNCFWGWSEMLSESGLANFYASDSFTDYPPGYMYILNFLGLLKKIFNIGDNLYLIILKLPAILCDIVTGYLIYKVSNEKFSQRFSLILSGGYMLNPAVLINSSLWGQVDSIYTLGIVLVLLLLCNKRITQSFFVFAICVFIKPQSLIFTPVLLFSIGEYVFLPRFDKKRLLRVFFCGMGALLLMIIMALPFGLIYVLKQYASTIDSYPYLTVNAFNIWGALGQNWTELTPYFSYLGMAAIAVITLISARIFFVNKGKQRYFQTAAFLIFATYMFSVKMHDRYAYPVMAMLIFAFLMSGRKSIFAYFSLLSLSQFFNQAWILFVYETDPARYADSPVIIIASIVNLLIFIAMTFLLARTTPGSIVGLKNIEQKENYFTKKDWAIVLSVAAVYSVFAFCDLGEMKAPKTSCEISYEDKITIKLDASENIESLSYYLGADAVEGDMYIDYYLDSELVLSDVPEDGGAFFWNERGADVSADLVEITTDKESLELFEVVLEGEDGKIFPESCNYDVLWDEQEIFPERVNFRNSAYFDEIYHARTAYEFVEGKEVYEWTHPPLGKVFIALGVKIFGMNPFGWRIVGTVFGVLMVFVIYALIKRIFKETFIAAVGCVLFTFDFMHFTQTRIATIDVYVTFFIMLMYYFMYKYYTMDFSENSLKKSFSPLLSAGICFGLGATCKWTAMYACAGLAVIFFMTVIRRFRKDREGFLGWFFKTCAFCVLVFIIIPVVIYCISYIPYLKASGDFSFEAIWQNQVDMLTYHGETVVNSEHPFASRWFSWPIIYRPMWYYEGALSETVKEGISAFGNPVVWWLGIPSLFICLYYAAIKRNKKAAFILIGYLSCLVPWIFVQRTTYIYHYFPCVVFSVLMTCFVLSELDFKSKRYAGVGVCTAAVVLFLLFYPVLSGEAVAAVYVDEVLRWMESWVLIG